MAFLIKRQSGLPFMFHIVRDNGRMIPAKLHGSFTSEKEATLFLNRYIKENSKDADDLPACGN